MPATFQEIINSRLFKFIVGETSDGIPTEFAVYEEAIAQLSKPLYSLVKGGLSEAQAGCTIWKDVSKETFERLVQFAYTGDYSIPKTVKRNRVVELERAQRNALVYRASSSTSNGIQTRDKAEELNETFAIEETKKVDPLLEEEGVEEPQECEPVTWEETADEPAVDSFGDWGGWGTSKKDKGKKGKNKGKVMNSSDWKTGLSGLLAKPEPSPGVQSKREKYLEPPSPRLLTADFSSLSFPLLAPRNNYDNTCEPAKQFEPGQSYSDVLLAHASLYVLGDYRLIDSLKALTLYKLHKTLCVFQLNDENVEDIIDLARYAYSEEGKGLDKGIGGLRGLVCRYMATNAVVLSHDNAFMDLLEGGGKFVSDFFKFELQMIH